MDLANGHASAVAEAVTVAARRPTPADDWPPTAAGSLLQRREFE
jgi:hypothetical protein